MPVCRVTSRSWIGPFDSAAVSGVEKNNAGMIHPVRAWQEFTAWCSALILRRLFELLEEFLVLFLAGAQGDGSIHRLQGPRAVVFFQARRSQEVIVGAGRFQ